ncbi:MAG TPA: hypothetical protein VLH60_04665 [Sedimentisphaerales bacterium]|nr:hypothetical protein [Sedimentisphaerales bacterium]
MQTNLVKPSRLMSRGITLIEMTTAITIGVITVLLLAVLLSAGQRNWAEAYNLANQGIQIDAIQTMINFGSIGRKSNKNNYRVYERTGNTFVRLRPSAANPVQIMQGDAVEFRYWEGELNAAYMDTTRTATTYALFYLDGTTLKMDIGPYSDLTGIGGVSPPDNGTRRVGPGIITRTIAENVSSLEFSHTTKNASGDGDGSVRMILVLTDPEDGRSVTVKAATLMRNVWP